MAHKPSPASIGLAVLVLAAVPMQNAAAADAGGGNTTTQTYDITGQDPKNADIFSFDYGVPSSPALTLAGLSTAKVTPATTLKPFVLSLPSVFDSASSNSTAAFDFAPGWITGTSLNAGSTTDALNQDAYQNSAYWFSRLFFRSRIGGALYRGDNGGGTPSKATPSQLAFGFSTTLSDSSDPLLATTPGTSASAWIGCLDKEASSIAPTPLTVLNRAAQHDVDLLQYYQTLAPNYDKLSNPAQQNLVGRLNVIEADKNVPGVLTESAAKRGSEAIAQRLTNDIADFQQAQVKAFNDAATKPNVVAQTAITDCKKEASTAAQQAPDLQAGAGVVMSGKPGAISGLSNPHFSAWIAGRLPLRITTPSAQDCGSGDNRSFWARATSCWMIGGTGHYSSGQMIATGNTTTPMALAEIKEGWGGLERIDASMKLGGYVGYVDQTAANSAQQSLVGSGVRWLISADFALPMIADGLWVEGSYGNATGSVSSLDDKTFMLSFSFGPPSIGSGFSNQGG